MKVVHLMAGGSAAGGIETLMADYAKASKNENIFIFIWGEGPSVDWIRATGCEVIVFNAKQTGNIRLIYDCIRTINGIDPDCLVIQHATPELRFIGILLAVRYSVFVYHHSNAINEYNSTGIKKFITHCIYMLSVRVSKKNIAISNSVKDSVRDMFKIHNNEIEVIYNGTDLSRFKPQMHAIKKPIRLIYVGRLEKVKGVQNILAGLHYANDLDFHLTIVGDGSYASKLKEICNEYGLNDKVDFLGHSNDVPHLLMESDIFFHLPDCEEGFGLSIIEAMASGLVCICGECGAIPEIIEDNTDGFLLDRDSYLSLGEIIASVMNLSYESYAKIISNAISKAKEFSIKKYAERMDRFLKEETSYCR